MKIFIAGLLAPGNRTKRKVSGMETSAANLLEEMLASWIPTKYHRQISFMMRRKPIKELVQKSFEFFKGKFTEESPKWCKGRVTKFMNIPTRFVRPVQKVTARIFCLGSGETFGGIFEEPLLSWGRSWTVFLKVFFLFVARLLGIFEFFLSNFCGKWIFIFIYFLFTSCSSLVRGQFSTKLNISISNLFTSCSTIVQSLLLLCHQYLLKSLSKDSNSVFPPNLNRKNWDPNDSFWARSPNFSPQIQVLRLVDALWKFTVFVIWTPLVTQNHTNPHLFKTFRNTSSDKALRNMWTIPNQ